MTASNVDRVESAANITLTVSTSGTRQSEDESNTATRNGDDYSGGEILKIPISQLDTTKEIEISEIRESSLKATGYSVTSISYSGSMMFKGERVHGPDNAPVSLENLLYDSEGVPKPCSITISHELSGKTETFEDVLVTSDAYEVQNESETETNFDWVAMDKNTENPATN